MSAPSAAAFLRKRKDKRPGLSRFPLNGPALPSSSGAGPSTASLPPLAAPTIPKAEPVASTSAPRDTSHLVEIKLFSAPPSATQDTRYNLMKLNYSRDFDPTTIPRPILLNRKLPGPAAAPVYAFNAEGEIVGKYKYDEDEKPVLGPDGKHIIEVREKADLSLIGGSAQRKTRKKAIREVYHQEKEVMRLRREEALPWKLESGSPAPAGQNGEGGRAPDEWVGRYLDPHSLPTVLFVNNGQDDGFQVIPLGRTYKFEPNRPFQPFTAEESNKVYEDQVKNKINDRWRWRAGGPAGPHVPVNGHSGAQVKRETGGGSHHEARARALEQRLRQNNGASQSKPKVERFDDDSKREGRGLQAGLEGGAGEELDYDEKEDFQDDDDVNTFYRDQDEEEEAKATEDRLKKEYRIANANVGDRPQIANELEEEEDLFGDKELTRDGRKLRKMMEKRRGSEDLFDQSDEDSDESEEEAPDKKAKDAEADKGKKKEEPPSAASRPPSRGPPGKRTERGVTSPGGSSRYGSPTPPGKKSSTAPPVSGASFVAQRAFSRGTSPSGRSRHTSSRAASPDGPSGARSPRAASPPMSSGSHAQSPPVGSSSRAQSPVLSQTATGSREGSPAGSVPKIKLKASTAGTASPAPSPNNSKRKPSPAPGGGSNDPPRKKKKGSNTPTPGPEDTFPGMVTKDEVIAWFRAHKSDRVPMAEIISAFKPRLGEPATQELRDRNAKVFLAYVGQVSVKGGDRMLQFKSEFK